MLLDPPCQRTIRNVLTDNHDLIVIDVSIDQWQHVRMAAGLNPDRCLLLESLDVYIFVAGQFQGELCRRNRRSFLGQPHHTETAQANLPDQRVRAELSNWFCHRKESNFATA